MTYLVNDPKRFPADSLKGMVAANMDYLQAVHGGVVRSTESPKGEVSVVVGGGTGHYPAFAGWVGPGMAHGAVCGNIFASPSTSQAESVVRAAENGGGTLLLFGNYAGDCLNFGAAAEHLEAEGLDTRIVTISDDIASNTPDKHDDRRGIAGDLFVVKIAAAAAAAGMTLDEVEEVANKANAKSRTLGVAFTGCTLPGAETPLFSVNEGEYALGLGIHGEPGISSHPMGTAAEIATLLTERVLEEQPTRGREGYDGHIAVLVNGLGATKYEELFVLYSTISDLLVEKEFTVVHPVVGEQVTSLDMAGVSLSIMFLDAQLERLWLAAADSPAYKTGSVEHGARRGQVSEEQARTIEPGSPESAAQAREAVRFVGVLADVAVAKESELGKLDSIVGDGDHGSGLVLGASAAVGGAKEAAAAGAGMAALFVRAGEAWAEGAGGTSGVVWGTAITAFGNSLSDERTASQEQLGRAGVTAARAAEALGGAKPGDKTMVDATHPFADELERQIESGATLAAAWLSAAKVATAAAEKTSELVARKGRARTHGEASVGHPDPGAVSFALLMTGVANALASESCLTAAAD
jgi:dihydroxyacetone kinase